MKRDGWLGFMQIHWFSQQAVPLPFPFAFFCVPSSFCSWHAGYKAEMRGSDYGDSFRVPLACDFWRETLMVSPSQSELSCGIVHLILRPFCSFLAAGFSHTFQGKKRILRRKSVTQKLSLYLSLYHLGAEKGNFSNLYIYDCFLVVT